MPKYMIVSNKLKNVVDGIPITGNLWHPAPDADPVVLRPCPMNAGAPAHPVGRYAPPQHGDRMLAYHRHAGCST